MIEMIILIHFRELNYEPKSPTPRNRQFTFLFILTSLIAMAQQKTANIVVLGGDGVGPEVVAEAVKILKIVSDKRSAARNIQFNFEDELIGLASMEKTGKH